MPVRPPSAFAPKNLADPLQAALEHEIMAEKAATLGRLLKVLEQKLSDLQTYEDFSTGPATDPILERKRDEAGEALWHVVIQRDICGFTRTDQFLRDMKIPATVRQRMGIVKNEKV